MKLSAKQSSNKQSRKFIPNIKLHLMTQVDDDHEMDAGEVGVAQTQKG